jgi:hypothetical protein
MLEQADHREKVRAKGKEGGMKDAMTAWNRVERNLRGTLRRVSTSPLVEELEVSSWLCSHFLIQIMLQLGLSETWPVVI